MTNAYPIAFNASHHLRKVENLVIEKGSLSKLSCVIICDDSRNSTHISTYCSSGVLIEDFTQAKSYLLDKTKTHTDVVFIDKVLSKKELIDFNNFLKINNLFSSIVIIYNDDKLNSEDVLFLQQNELIDDAISFTNKEINYLHKVTFLKRVKKRQVAIASKNRVIRRAVVKQKIESSVKRFLDILLSSLALIIMLPLFLLIALIIKLESKGPVFYTSNRAGRGFKVFKFYKFRTMEVDADKKIKELVHLNLYGSDKESKFVKLKNDPRVTRFGKFLRKTSIDEIPQFLNVLKGDMSLVGNRPLPLYEATELTTNDSVERFMAPAGITGLWQIKKRGKEDMSVEERITLDIFYARKASLAYDLWIMANTPGVLFQKENM